MLVLALVLGFYWIVHGITELFVAIGHAELPSRWLILSGVLSVAAGVIVVVAPGISLFALAIVLGVWLIVFGAITLVRALQIWSAASAAHAGNGYRLRAPGPAWRPCVTASRVGTEYVLSPKVAGLALSARRVSERTRPTTPTGTLTRRSVAVEPLGTL